MERDEKGGQKARRGILRRTDSGRTAGRDIQEAIEVKFLIVVPFWRNRQHVGVYRVDRFLRWLERKNIPVVLIRSGNDDHAEIFPWGVEISIRDPLLKIHNDPQTNQFGDVLLRWSKSLIRQIMNQIIYPDLEMIWARRVAAHPLILKYAGDITHVLSSSPPESPHVAASRLAHKLGAKLVVDMRDGWLDEPLKPLLRRSRLRQRQEGVLERRILEQAEHIFVTSEEWRELLEARLPCALNKTAVLTNAYPLDETADQWTIREKAPDKTGRTKLLHVGRFTGSSKSRRPRHLLEPLLRGAGDNTGPCEVTLLGDLRPSDSAEIRALAPQFEALGWSLVTLPRVSREESLQILKSADGLLLLSTSHAAIPSKLFEYIPSGKPVLALTPRQSAVWKIGEELSQLYLVDYTQDNQDWISTTTDFIDSAQRNTRGDVPPEFTEEHTSRIFYNTLLDV
jgi:hypothetical protein